MFQVNFISNTLTPNVNINSFGMRMPDRYDVDHTSYPTSYPLPLNDYRYAYNGMELDNSVSGTGNSYTTEFRQYDPRLARWKSLDPLMAKFPDVSPYVAFDNNPIKFVDPKGLSPTTNDDGGDEPGFWSKVWTEALDWVPLVGTVKGAWEGITGERWFTGEKLATWERVIGWIPYVKKVKYLKLIGVFFRRGRKTSVILLEKTDDVIKKTDDVLESAEEAQEKYTIIIESSKKGKRRKNRLPDEGEPNTMRTNQSGTTTKKYGPDGKIQKEYNKGHQGSKTPKKEKKDHVHDYKPSKHPKGKPERQPGRKPKKNEQSKDKYKSRSKSGSGG